jgi:shikimate kinase / 3-dehydroquinate synthase
MPEITRNAGRSIPEIFDAEGEQGFRSRETAALTALANVPASVVACGGGIVLIDENRRLLKQTGVVVYLKVSAGEAIARIGDTTGRPLLASGDAAHMAATLLATRETLYGTVADAVVDTGGLTPERVADAVFDAIARDQPRGSAVVSGEARLVVPRAAPRTRSSSLTDCSGRQASTCGRSRDGARCALVTDDNVYGMFGATVSTSLRDAGIEAVEIVVPHGEPSKRWDRAGEVLEQMAAARLERTDLVVALGGGVIGDLAGFCAAVYLRGVDYVQLPTTLLSQVDSSVGGKTGVDLRAGKNLAGAFKQPLLVLADTSALGTLPDEEWRSGLAEVAKAAMLTGPDQVEWMIAQRGRTRASGTGSGREAVLAAVRHKIGVVSADEHETGLRESLNYGHTLGHAIERVAGYGVVPHGVAVAEGMRFAARLAVRVLGASAGGGVRARRPPERPRHQPAGVSPGCRGTRGRDACGQEGERRDGALCSRARTG